MVRKGTIEDIESVNVLLKQVSELHIQGVPDIFKNKDFNHKDYIKMYIDKEDAELLVCEENGEVVSFIMFSYVLEQENEYMYEQKYVYIDDIGTNKNHQGKGYGQQLLDRTKELVKEKGFNQIKLNLYSFNKNAERFYVNNGFKVYSQNMQLDI